MIGLPEGKGLFAFSDQASANACLALAYMLIQEKNQRPVLITNQSRHLKNPFGLEVLLTEEAPDLKSIKPSYVFTGTSHPESSQEFEISIINEAKKYFIYSIAFIDHWVNFRIRFLMHGNLIEPDEIWVVNKEAKKLAIAEGLNEKRIHIHNNPYHDFLATIWKPKYYGKTYLEEPLGLSINNSFIILYAPDPISLRRQEDKPGFDEVSVLESLLSVLEKIGETGILLIVKPHPLQHQQLLKDRLRRSSVKSIFVCDVDNHELINAADVVIGIYSNFLIESERLGKPVIRIIQGSEDSDLLRYTNTGKVVKSERELFESLINYIQ